MDNPLHDALKTAKLAAETAQEAFNECECEELRCQHFHASCAADEAVSAARKAISDSDEPRSWILREEGHDYDTIEACSLEDALEEAKSNVDRGNYGDAEGTLYINVSARCEETEEEDSCTVTCDPDEPECDNVSHDWKSPYRILGGLKENPGVWGHGGGVIIREVCMHCGCEKTTDTWAQNPENGEQGLTSVSYEPGKYSEEIAESA